MIATDQPTCFPSDVRVTVSSKDDGTQLDRTGEIHAPKSVEDRRRFCELNGVDYAHAVYQLIVYGDNQTYDRIVEVGKSSTTRFVPGVAADGLVTREPGVGLFLPVADWKRLSY